MPGTVEVYRESRENCEPAWRKGITMKPTRCTGLYFLGETSFHVCVYSCGCHLAFGASMFPDHSTVNLASPLAVSNWIAFTVDLPTHVRPLVCLDRCGVSLWQPRNNFANFSC